MEATDTSPSFGVVISLYHDDWLLMSVYVYKLPAPINLGKTFDKFYGVQHFEGAFTSAECIRIRESIEALPRYMGKTSSAYLKRDAKIRWVNCEASTEWIFLRFARIALAANERYQFRLSGFREPLQHSTYAAGGMLGCHTDLGERGGRFRKLSMTVQLSDESEYEGGDLLFPSIEGGAPPKAIGTAIVFPSFLAHEVAKVAAGSRESLSAWVCGPAFS